MFKVNEYFDGTVKSIAFGTPEGPATIGVMAPGEYEFGTAQREIMHVVSGALTVKLPDASQWETFAAGNHRDHGCSKGAQQIQEQNRLDVGFLAMLMVGDRRHHQHKHQDRCHGLECRDEDLADKTGGLGRLGQQQGQQNAGDQTDDDLCDQADAR